MGLDVCAKVMRDERRSVRVENHWEEERETGTRSSAVPLWRRRERDKGSTQEQDSQQTVDSSGGRMSQPYEKERDRQGWNTWTRARQSANSRQQWREDVPA